MARLHLGMVLALVLGCAAGCAGRPHQPEYAQAVTVAHVLSQQPPGPLAADGPLAAALDPPPAPPDLAGSQPVEVYIQRALAENRDVQAARHDVQALASRIPQVTALDDPQFMGTIFPVPAIAPQYSLMGYMPFSYTLAQQFPWFGTLRLRGQVAEQEVKMALQRLAAAQLEVVSEVKRAYYDLYLNQRVAEILEENRRTASEIVELAQARAVAGSQQDLLRAEVALAEIDREILPVRQALVQARAELAQLLHVSPETDLRTVPEIAAAAIPGQIDQLYRMAAASRPELQERLAAIARDEREVELARKRYYPDITLGLEQWKMSRHGAQSPTAGGVDNIGLVIGFNLPVYRKKLAAAVCEAESKTVADARRYEADRDRTNREIKDLVVQSRTQADLIALLETTILPKSTKALELAAAAYPAGDVDYVTLNTGRLELLNIQLQIARLQAEQGKTLASLERVVGLSVSTEEPPSEPAPPPPAATSPGPFQPPS